MSKLTKLRKGDVVWWHWDMGGKQYFDELVTVIAIRKSYRGKRPPDEHRTIKVERKRPGSELVGWVSKQDLIEATNTEQLSARLTNKYEREVIG